MSLWGLAFVVLVNVITVAFLVGEAKNHAKRESLRPSVDLRPGEVLLDDIYARYHPARASTQTGPGRLYLTSERLIWRRLPEPPIFDPKFVPLLNEVELDATDIQVVEVKNAFPLSYQPEAELLVRTGEVSHRIGLVQPYLQLWGISKQARRWQNSILAVASRAHTETTGNSH